MSQKYSGGFITKSPVAPTSSAASGIWTLDQQQQAQKAGTWPSPPMFIEDLFSTYLYTGTGAAQTITNGIDLSGQGGMVWQKSRSAAGQNFIFDTARGALQYLSSNSTNASANYNESLTAFNTNGFNLGFNLSNSGETDVTWTFRKQPKFFDIVTYTGDGVSTGRAIAHSLGSAVGAIFVKCTSNPSDWPMWHNTFTSLQGMYLNTTQSKTSNTFESKFGNGTTVVAPTSSVYTVGIDLNESGFTYVAYLFAHDAGGFPVSGGGSTNGISCGSYVSNGSTISVNLGYEPQWILIKKATGAANNWTIVDSMRGLTANATNASAPLFPNLSDAEAASSSTEGPAANSTGFSIPYSSSAFNYPSGETYIYIAIRRGPMKPPTVGTSVYQPVVYTGDSVTPRTISTTITPDAAWFFHRNDAFGEYWFDRLRGSGNFIRPSGPDVEATWVNAWYFDVQDAIKINSGTTYINTSPSQYGLWAIKRAPGFFDVVCYTGTGVGGLAVTHNLGAVPELMMFKKRNGAESWIVYTAPTGNAAALYLSSTAALETAGGAGYFNNTTPTATQFTVGNYTSTNSGNMIAYLFATLSGISKVGSYTGTGALLTVNCGFTTGARFVFIKRTDSTGAWFTYDSARGITAGDDPYLLLNSTDAEVTNTNYVDTDTTGFKVTAAAPAALNASGGTYIFLAIA